jgi:hypothetical protein
VTNVDKPELPRGEVERRLHQFATIGTVWVTRAPTFVQKAGLFPGSSFILGWDTAVRVIDPRYYGGIATRDAALEKFRDYGCRFVVAGRADATGSFRVWNCPLAGAFAELFLPLTEADFRVDISSTYLRGLESKPAS